MEDEKPQGENNDVSFSCGSLSLWGAGGGAMEAGGEEAEKGDGSAKREELGKAVAGGGEKGEDEAAAEQVELHIQTERERRRKMSGMFGALHALIPHLPPKTDKATIVESAVSYVRTLEERLQTLQHRKQEKLEQAKNGVGFNSFPPSPSSMIPPQPLPQPPPYEPMALPADHHLRSSSSSRSITPPNSNPTTPKTHNAPGSPIMMMLNPNSNSSSPRETSVRLTLSPSSVMFRTFTSKNVVLCVCGEEASFNICGARRPGFYTGIASVLDKYRLEAKSCHISSDPQSNRTTVMIQARATALLDQYPAEEIYKRAAVEMVQVVST